MYRWLKDNKNILEEERSLPTIDPSIDDSNYELADTLPLIGDHDAIRQPPSEHDSLSSLEERQPDIAIDVSSIIATTTNKEENEDIVPSTTNSSIKPDHITDVRPNEETAPPQHIEVEIIHEPTTETIVPKEEEKEEDDEKETQQPQGHSDISRKESKVSFSLRETVIREDEQGHTTIEQQDVAMNTNEISANIEWFRLRLNNAAGVKHCITPDDLKRVFNEEPSEFAEKLFELVDTDRSGSISQQELIGGLSRLTVKGKKKVMKWFEEIFVDTAGEDQLLQLDEFEKALRTSGFIEKFFQLMDHAGSGKLTVPQILDALGKLPCMGKDANWLSWFENQFSDIAGEDRQIDFEEFKKALQLSKSSFFVQRFFDIFDEDKSGTISLSEMMAALTLLLQGTQIEKLQFLFKVYDVDGNGMIDYEELKTVLKSCMDESALTFSEENLEELATALFQDADTDESGTVSFDELQAELEKYPDIIENLTISAANWLKPQKRARKKSFTERLPSWLSWKHIRNNWSYFLFLSVFVIINLGLFLQAAIRYRDGGVFLALARGGGACLNFNPVLVLMLMFRQIITLIRSTPIISSLLPVDKYIKLHKTVGYTIFFFTIEHFLAHLANLSRFEIEDTENPSCNHSMWFCLIGVDTGLGWVGGSAGLTGFLLTIILIIMVVCSLPIVRRKGAFEIFFFSHNLFVLFYIILILHAPDFWKWFIVPALIYIAERIYRSKLFKFIRYGRTYIHAANVLPSKVTHLSITRPSNFNFQPGDYVFIQIPDIARYEWHPFTISSAPEMKDYFWLHIRGVGSWTNKLYDYYDEKLKSGKVLKKEGTLIGNKSFSIAEEPRRMSRSPSLPHNTMSRSSAYFQTLFCGDDPDKRTRVHIDGPYGTPSVHIFQAEHAVLIGSGIGVTPYASILQSIVRRFKHTRQTCPNCQHSWTESLPSTVMKLRKVDFFWINRHQKHFEWFVNLLSELELEQNDEGAVMDRFLDMHMYITSALQKTDVKAVVLQMALDLIHKEKKVDLITGLKTRTQPGRPNWNKIFQELKENRRGQVTVFFCGSPMLASVLSQKCDEYGFKFRKENF